MALLLLLGRGLGILEKLLHTVLTMSTTYEILELPPSPSFGMGNAIALIPRNLVDIEPHGVGTSYNTRP